MGLRKVIRLLSSPRRIIQAFQSHFFRLYVFSILAVVLIWALMGIASYSYYSNKMAQDLHLSLELELARLVLMGEEQGQQAIVNDLKELRYAMGLRSFYYLLKDADGNRLAGNLTSWPETLVEFRTIQKFDVPLPTYYGHSSTPMKGTAARLLNGNTLLVAQSTVIFEVFTNYVLGFSQAVLIILFVFAILLSLARTIILQNSFENLNRTIERIMAGNLRERIPIGVGNVESRELAVNINNMLDKINILMDDVRRVSDNIAHDLNTPLARLRNDIKSLLKRTRPEDEPRVEAILGECNALLETFNALLRVAKIETSETAEEASLIDLSQLLNDVIDLYEPLANESDIEVTTNLQNGNTAYGDKNLIFQVIANIVDNAIKYSESDGSITLQMSRGINRDGTEILAPSAVSRVSRELGRLATEAFEYNHYVTICVSDAGIGVPAQSYQKIFRRFYREEKSRGLKPGSGLGLSMVMAVMQIHEGGIYLRDNKPGLSVSLVFPASDLSKVTLSDLL